MEPRQHRYETSIIDILSSLCMHPPTAIFVAGFSREKHNELLQLLLPEKLLPVDKQVKLLSNDYCLTPYPKPPLNILTNPISSNDVFTEVFLLYPRHCWPEETSRSVAEPSLSGQSTTSSLWIRQSLFLSSCFPHSLSLL